MQGGLKNKSLVFKKLITNQFNFFSNQRFWELIVATICSKRYLYFLKVEKPVSKQKVTIYIFRGIQSQTSCFSTYSFPSTSAQAIWRIIAPKEIGS